MRVRVLSCVGLVAVVLGAARAQTPPAPPGAAKRWVGRVPPPADPLDPWPLEPAPATQPTPVAPAVPTDTTAVAVPDSAAPGAPIDSSDVVEVVRCRQILVSDPARVPQLERLLHDGMPLEQALLTVGIADVDESRRVYALDDIDPRLAAEIAALPDSGWSTPRPWRGRTVLVQVLDREERPRHTLPKLGENLDDKEKSRLASQLRAPERATTAQLTPEADYKPAAAVEQVQAQYPPAANEAGEVTVVVEVGRVGEVLGVRIENSTARIFEEPAIAAARASKYKAAERSGFAEPGTVRLTYKFAAPQAGTTPQP